MNRTTVIYVTIVIAGVFLAAGYFLAGQNGGVIAALVLAVLWLIGEWRGWRWAGSIGLFFFALIALVGIWLGVTAVFAILSLVAALLAWDMSSFKRLLAGVSWVRNEDLLERQYRQRLLIVAVTGIILAVLATTVRVTFSFTAALFLGLLAIIGLSRALSFLRQDSDCGR